MARKTTHMANSASALAGALTTQKSSRREPQRFRRSGRTDSRCLSRVGVGDLNVFVRRGAPAPNKIRCTILVDASGSMQGGYDAMAMQTCRNLADAIDMLPHVTAKMWAFTTYANKVALYDLWESGKPTTAVDSYDSVQMVGTMEGYAIAYAIDDIIETKSDREKALIIIVSDGAPSEANHVKAMVKLAKTNDIPVVSVALVPIDTQVAMYGAENVINYNGNDRKLAKDMAKAIGRVL